jgi:DedD protein
MALFKFRKGRDEQPAPSKKKPAPTVEVVRRRAMHRLIGAAVLVLAGVIGFPLIFDNQPRPIQVDLPIEIVDRNKARPLVVPPVAPAAESAAAAPAKEAAPAAAPVATTPAPAAPVAPPAAPAAASSSTASVAPAAPKAAAEVPETRALDAKKARALLEGRAPVVDAPAAPAKTAAADTAKPPAKPAATSDDRYVVQVGAFADAAKVREVRRKVEAAGLKTYTQVVGTSEGDRTRVRVGPFSDRAQADKAAEKIRKLNLTAAILTL